MPETLSAIQEGRLERSCGPRGDSIRVGAGAEGIERVEAFFGGRAFEPHRHDTYAIGMTTTGVQRFRYRGAERRCLPGQLHFLHPDETHDGRAGTDAGFGYRILYVAPSLVQEALHGRPLPFVADPVQSPSPATAGLAALLRDMDEPLDELGRAAAAAAVADALTGAGGDGEPAEPIDLAAVTAVRDTSMRIPPPGRGRTCSSASPASTGGRSPATSGRRSGRVLTVTARCGGWPSPVARSPRAHRSPRRRLPPGSPTRAT